MNDDPFRGQFNEMFNDRFKFKEQLEELVDAHKMYRFYVDQEIKVSKEINELQEAKIKLLEKELKK